MTLTEHKVDELVEQDIYWTGYNDAIKRGSKLLWNLVDCCVDESHYDQLVLAAIKFDLEMGVSSERS